MIDPMRLRDRLLPEFEGDIGTRPADILQARSGFDDSSEFDENDSLVLKASRDEVLRREPKTRTYCVVITHRDARFHSAPTGLQFPAAWANAGKRGKGPRIRC